MKNPIKIEIRQTDGNEIDVAKLKRVKEDAKALYEVYLKEESRLSMCLAIASVCHDLLTKEERQEIEVKVYGRTFEEAEKERLINDLLH